MEQFYPFNTGAGQLAIIQPRTGISGKLTLQTVTGGPVFLFRGVLTKEQCEAALKPTEKGVCGFELACSEGGGSAELTIEENPGQLTVFSKNAETIGFVLIAEKSCNCH